MYIVKLLTDTFEAVGIVTCVADDVGVALELLPASHQTGHFAYVRESGMVILLADFISPVLQNLQGCEDREAIFCLTEAAQFVVESRHKTGIMNQYRVFSFINDSVYGVYGVGRVDKRDKLHHFHRKLLYLLKFYFLLQ